MHSNLVLGAQEPLVHFLRGCLVFSPDQALSRCIGLNNFALAFSFLCSTPWNCRPQPFGASNSSLFEAPRLRRGAPDSAQSEEMLNAHLWARTLFLGRVPPPKLHVPSKKEKCSN